MQNLLLAIVILFGGLLTFILVVATIQSENDYKNLKK